MEAKELLVERLKERQGDRTQNEFAEYLRISRAMLSRLYSQDRRIGLDTLTRICERFPDLAFFFLSESISVDNIDSEDSPQESPQAAPEPL